MKSAIKAAFYLLTLIIVANSHAGTLKNDKSEQLLNDIREDISGTLNSIAEIESQGDWTVYLSQTDGRLVRMGMVIEPSTDTVLSVAADGAAKSMGLLAGDVITSIKVNGKSFDKNLSSAQFTHGDELEIIILRNGDMFTFAQQIESSFVPKWQLYSSTQDSLGTTIKTTSSKRLSMNLQSQQSIALLQKLKGRINYMLSEIYKLESREGNVLDLDLSKVARVSTELGVTVDSNNKVLSVKKNSNAKKVGVQIGDIIEGISLNEDSQFSNKLTSVKLKPGDNFKLDVLRGGRRALLRGTIIPIVNPSWSMSVKERPEYNEGDCGTITTIYDPPASWFLFTARIAKINGDRVIGSGLSYTLPAGMNQLKIFEEIPVSETGFSLSKSYRAYPRSKTINFYVKPNKKYYLGSKLIKSKRQKTRNGEYWEPYVWKVEDYECSLDE